MDPVRNPFAPGAGNPPPELAGRNNILDQADICLQRTLLGKHAQSQILLGLRGVGKTVLLNKIEEKAKEHRYYTSFIEAPDNSRFVDMLYPKLYTVIRHLSMIEAAKKTAHSAMSAVRSFVASFKVKVGDAEFSVDPAKGVADSGRLDNDLTDIFLKIGEAAQAAGGAWALFVDEVQYLKAEEFSAIIVAMHRISQKQLPVLFFGAGLPQAAGLAGEAKSYAERLFSYPPVGALAKPDACAAIRIPIEEEAESIDDSALERIFEKTKGYPFFLQEWGYQAWNIAGDSPISVDDIDAATPKALERLDHGFFKSRYDRLTRKEREYVIAMARLEGEGPWRSSDIAALVGENLQSIGPRRAQIINKGVIYSPSHGDVDFTVPLFKNYLIRNWVN